LNGREAAKTIGEGRHGQQDGLVIEVESFISFSHESFTFCFCLCSLTYDTREVGEDGVLPCLGDASFGIVADVEMVLAIAAIGAGIAPAERTQFKVPFLG